MTNPKNPPRLYNSDATGLDITHDYVTPTWGWYLYRLEGGVTGIFA